MAEEKKQPDSKLDSVPYDLDNYTVVSETKENYVVPVIIDSVKMIGLDFYKFFGLSYLMGVDPASHQHRAAIARKRRNMGRGFHPDQYTNAESKAKNEKHFKTLSWILDVLGGDATYGTDGYLNELYKYRLIRSLFRSGKRLFANLTDAEKTVVRRIVHSNIRIDCPGNGGTIKQFKFKLFTLSDGIVTMPRILVANWLYTTRPSFLLFLFKRTLCKLTEVSRNFNIIFMARRDIRLMFQSRFNMGFGREIERDAVEYLGRFNIINIDGKPTQIVTFLPSGCRPLGDRYLAACAYLDPTAIQQSMILRSIAMAFDHNVDITPHSVKIVADTVFNADFKLDFVDKQIKIHFDGRQIDADGPTLYCNDADQFLRWARNMPGIHNIISRANKSNDCDEQKMCDKKDILKAELNNVRDELSKARCKIRELNEELAAKMAKYTNLQYACDKLTDEKNGLRSINISKDRTIDDLQNTLHTLEQKLNKNQQHRQMRCDPPQHQNNEPQGQHNQFDFFLWRYVNYAGVQLLQAFISGIPLSVCEGEAINYLKQLGLVPQLQYFSRFRRGTVFHYWYRGVFDNTQIAQAVCYQKFNRVNLNGQTIILEFKPYNGSGSKQYNNVDSCKPYNGSGHGGKPYNDDDGHNDTQYKNPDW